MEYIKLYNMELSDLTIEDINKFIDKFESELIMKDYHDGWTLKWIKSRIEYWSNVKCIIFG